MVRRQSFLLLLLFYEYNCFTNILDVEKTGDLLQPSEKDVVDVGDRMTIGFKFCV